MPALPMNPSFRRNLFHLFPLLLLAAAANLAADADAPSSTPPAAPKREVLSFDEGWRFHPGDIPFPEIRGHGMTYGHAKAGNASGAAAMDYNDSSWRLLNLPHDWAVEGPFDKEANVSQGYRPRGFAWYRKSFRIDPADKGKHLELQIDGVSTHCTVWVNGTEVHHNNCGYTGFTVDLTPFARFGNALNTVAVRVDAQEQEGWWYEGAGMYRHTRLLKRPPLHIVTDGVFAQPVKKADGTWEIPAEVTLENSGKEPAEGSVTMRILSPDGKEVATGSGKASVPVLGRSVVKFSITVKDPLLWSPDHPTLYKVETSVSSPGGNADQVAFHCGFRTIRFDAEKGFFINDQPLKIQGTCNHMDHAGVGTAVPDSLWDFRIRKLKEMGSNAYRCSHNPPPAEFLDACDRLGMLVMDESRNFNCAPEYMDQMRWMVRRDRNHPSVILWSVFNEEPMQATEQGCEMVRRMSAAVKELDTTRPVTAAMSGGHFAPSNVSQVVDVVGFNYGQGGYDKFHKAHPEIPITSSEDTSAFMTRGEYVTDKSRNIIASYDDERAPWGATHHDGWKRIAERPFVAGGFVWTGFDYRGEPTPHTWPSAGSFFGCMDLCGFPKAAFFMHQAHWIKDRPVLEIVPHWNWKGREGKPVRVMVISNAPKAELFLNGKSLGEKDVDPYAMVGWEVPYEAGVLEAVSRKDGKEVARTKVETTGDGVALELIPDRKEIWGDGRDAMPVTVRVVDANGHPVPTASPMVSFTVEGPVAQIGLGNGDPNCHEPEKATSHSLFNGLGQAILQSLAGGKGDAVLKVSSPGLKDATVILKVREITPIPFVPSVTPDFQITRWKRSSFSETRPDVLAPIPDSDMNSWEVVELPSVQKSSSAGWFQFRSEPFQPIEQVRKKGGTIRFERVLGRAEFWLDGKKVSEKGKAPAGPVEISLPPGANDHSVILLFHADASEDVGIGGKVFLDKAPPRKK